MALPIGVQYEYRSGKKIKVYRPPRDHLIFSIPDEVFNDSDIVEIIVGRTNRVVAKAYVNNSLSNEIERTRKEEDLNDLKSRHFVLSIPSEIGKLSNLEYLEIQNAQIKEIPFYLSTLRKLKVIFACVRLILDIESIQ